MRSIVARDTKKDLEKEIDKLLKDAEKEEFTKSHAHLPLEKRIELTESKKKHALQQKAVIEKRLMDQAAKKQISRPDMTKEMTRLAGIITFYDHGIQIMKDAIAWRDHTGATTEDINIEPSGAKLEQDKIKGFALPAGHTCPKKGQCPGHCFAMGGRTEHQPSCQQKHAKNLGMSERDDFVELMNKKLAKWKKTTPPWKAPFRVHPWGDFLSNKYAEKWLKIAEANPDIWFYAYTKSHRMPAIKALVELPNVKIIQSYNGKDDDKIDELANSKMAVCKVFEDEAAFTAYNEKHKGKEFVECKNSDLVAADPANKRIGIVKHGKLHVPKHFDVEEIISSVKKEENDEHFAHDYDQIDAPHHWSRADHKEFAKHMGWDVPFKKTVDAKYRVKTA